MSFLAGGFIAAALFTPSNFNETKNLIYREPELSNSSSSIGGGGTICNGGEGGIGGNAVTNFDSTCN